MTLREFSIAAPLLALAIYFGVNPNALLKYMQPSVDKTVVELTDWTKKNEPAPAAKPATADATIKPTTTTHSQTFLTTKTRSTQRTIRNSNRKFTGFVFRFYVFPLCALRAFVVNK